MVEFYTDSINIKGTVQSRAYREKIQVFSPLSLKVDI